MENKKNIINKDAYRYERKFIIPLEYLNELNIVISSHPSRFEPIYSERIINNIYFDTIDFDFYKQNVDGECNRDKFRIRWYGDMFGKIKPKIEIKSKRGIVGNKKTFDLSYLELNSDTSGKKFREEILKQIINTNIYAAASILYPTLMNQYKRKYFLSLDKKFRITLDTNMIFMKITHNLRNKFFNEEYTPFNILEIKYQNYNANIADEISSILPFRVSKFSKYVHGLQIVSGLSF